MSKTASLVVRAVVDGKRKNLSPDPRTPKDHHLVYTYKDAVRPLPEPKTEEPV